MERKPLGNGEVWIYDVNGCRLHAWQTGDAMEDACFVLETPTGLVGIESPPFREDVATWKAYVTALGKPLTDVLLDAHPAGGRWFGAATSRATAGAKLAIERGATGALRVPSARRSGLPLTPTSRPLTPFFSPGPTPSAASSSGSSRPATAMTWRCRKRDSTIRTCWARTTIRSLRAWNRWTTL